MFEAQREIKRDDAMIHKDAFKVWMACGVGKVWSVLTAEEGDLCGGRLEKQTSAAENGGESLEAR